MFSDNITQYPGGFDEGLVDSMWDDDPTVQVELHLELILFGVYMLGVGIYITAKASTDFEQPPSPSANPIFNSYGFPGACSFCIFH